MHYTTEIQYYVTFEVLECNWAEFKEKLTKVLDFDELVATHKEFLEKLVRACLLAKDNKTIFGKMRSTFDRIQQFSEIQTVEEKNRKLKNTCCFRLKT